MNGIVTVAARLACADRRRLAGAVAQECRANPTYRGNLVSPDGKVAHHRPPGRKSEQTGGGAEIRSGPAGAPAPSCIRGLRMTTHDMSWVIAGDMSVGAGGLLVGMRRGRLADRSRRSATWSSGSRSRRPGRSRFCRGLQQGEGVGGTADDGYSVFLDILHTDGEIISVRPAALTWGRRLARREVYDARQPGRRGLAPRPPPRPRRQGLVQGMELYSVRPPDGQSSVATNGRSRGARRLPSPAAEPDIRVAKLVAGQAGTCSSRAASGATSRNSSETGPLSLRQRRQRQGDPAWPRWSRSGRPARPILAMAYSKAEEVKGLVGTRSFPPSSTFAYTDGSQFYGDFTSFSTGTHDWERRELYIMPAKPIRQVSYRVVLRDHTGKAWFRDLAFGRRFRPPADGAPVATSGPKPLELVDMSGSPSPEPAKSPPPAKLPPPVTQLVKASDNRFDPFAFNGYEQGFERQREAFFCDNNGADAKAARGVTQTVVLRQTKPEPDTFVAVYSKAEAVKGPVDGDYAVRITSTAPTART